jgi:hypothetical protein
MSYAAHDQTSTHGAEAREHHTICLRYRMTEPQDMKPQDICLKEAHMPQHLKLARDGGLT